MRGYLRYHFPMSKPLVLSARLKEAAKLGFESATLPRRVAHGNRKLTAPDGLTLNEIGHIADLVARFAPATAQA